MKVNLGKKREDGKLRSSIVTSEKVGGVKKEIARKEEEETVRSKHKASQSVMLCRDVVTVTMSYGFNSVSCQVGIEMPMACEPNDFATASKNMDRVELLVQKKLKTKVADMNKVLSSLKRNR